MTNPNDTTGDEMEDEGGMVDPETGLPFPDTPEGRAAKKEYITERRDAKHPHGGPPGQSRTSKPKKGDDASDAADQG